MSSIYSDSPPLPTLSLGYSQASSVSLTATPKAPASIAPPNPAKLKKQLSANTVDLDSKPSPILSSGRLSQPSQGII